MSLLGRITGTGDLKELSTETLAALAQEIRAFLIDKVSDVGGHLGPNLGVVELTIAAHRVFNSPRDVLLFDTGHQAYAHKILTGRCAEFDSLRQVGGLSGYPSRAESIHDVIENSHASTALSYADGLAKAFALRGETGRRVVAIIGDGTLTGGICSLDVADGPTVIRYPKATAGPDIAAIDRIGECDILRDNSAAVGLLIAVGPMAGPCLAAADELTIHDVPVSVVGPRWIAPSILPAHGLDAADRHRRPQTTRQHTPWKAIPKEL